uniref:Uncharacterized protein n=1 Tax=Panagrolaimus davidi TaxID=227884 RepID=A0A914P0Q4_9BILA
MSEFYGILTLKGYCDEWLSKQKRVINEKNVYELVEFAQRYSLKAFLGTIERIIDRYLDVFFATAKQAENGDNGAQAGGNLQKGIKAELTGILSNINYRVMDLKYIIQFIVAKGILSRDGEMHARDMSVEIRNAGKILTGTFKDDFNIFDGVKNYNDGYSEVSHKCKSKQRFFDLKCPIPKTPSTVQK